MAHYDAFGAIAEQDQLTAKGAVSLTKLALRFMGNASMQILHERRKQAIEEMNGKLVELAEKDSIYEKAAPALFGDQFAKKAKEKEDQLRALNRATNRSNFQRPQNYFQTAALTVQPREWHEPRSTRLPIRNRKGTLPPISVQNIDWRKRKLCPEGERKDLVKKRTNRPTVENTKAKVLFLCSNHYLLFIPLLIAIVLPQSHNYNSSE